MHKNLTTIYKPKILTVLQFAVYSVSGNSTLIIRNKMS